MKPPGNTNLHWKVSHGIISGIFLVEFQEKLKEHPKCSYKENKEEMDGKKELPKNFPSLWPQMVLNHFNFHTELFP